VSEVSEVSEEEGFNNLRVLACWVPKADATRLLHRRVHLTVLWYLGRSRRRGRRGRCRRIVDSPARGDHGFAGRSSEDQHGPSAQMHGQHSVPRPPDRGENSRGGNWGAGAAAGERDGVATEAANHGMGNRGPLGGSRRFVPRPPPDRSIGSGSRDNERNGASQRDVPHQSIGNSERNFGRGSAERQAQPASPHENNLRSREGGDNGSPRSRAYRNLRKNATTPVMLSAARPAFGRAESKHPYRTNALSVQ
jgi:hypothetical protein